MGYADRGAQATHVVVPEAHLLAKPPALTWEVAGSLYTAGTIAWTAVEGLALSARRHDRGHGGGRGRRMPRGAVRPHARRDRGGHERRGALRLPVAVRRDPDRRTARVSPTGCAHSCRGR